MKLTAAFIWLAGAAIPIVLGAGDADAALFVKALWLSAPFALLTVMWLRLRERGDRIAIAAAFVMAAAAEAWICRPVGHIAPFYLVPVVLFPIAATIAIPALYFVVTILYRPSSAPSARSRRT